MVQVGLGKCFIKVDAYSALFLEKSELEARWRKTYVYRLNGKTDVWASLPAFDSESSASG